MIHRQGRLRRAGFAFVALALLSACTSTEATLDPSAIKAQPAEPAQPAPSTATPSTTASTPPASTPPANAPAAPVQAAVNPVSARVQLAGVIGAPTPAVGPFSARLTEQAATKSFSVVPGGDSSATHSLKGFFSTSPENGQTVIFYVWDVADAKGVRVHRFSGQHKAAGQGAGWAGVTDADMQAIADQTAADFAAWLATPKG